MIPVSGQTPGGSRVVVEGVPAVSSVSGCSSVVVWGVVVVNGASVSGVSSAVELGPGVEGGGVVGTVVMGAEVVVDCCVGAGVLWVTGSVVPVGGLLRRKK